MTDILRPVLELSVIIPGILLSYLPVKSYLRQTPLKLTAWRFFLFSWESVFSEEQFAVPSTFPPDGSCFLCCLLLCLFIIKR